MSCFVINQWIRRNAESAWVIHYPKQYRTTIHFLIYYTHLLSFMYSVLGIQYFFKVYIYYIFISKNNPNNGRHNGSLFLQVWQFVLTASWWLTTISQSHLTLKTMFYVEDTNSRKSFSKPTLVVTCTKTNHISKFIYWLFLKFNKNCYTK